MIKLLEYFKNTSKRLKLFTEFQNSNPWQTNNIAKIDPNKLNRRQRLELFEEFQFSIHRSPTGVVDIESIQLVRKFSTAPTDSDAQREGERRIIAHLNSGNRDMATLAAGSLLNFEYP
ncbi:hypothetical protein [Pseudoprimorskyibacter insulae]|uniref:hypothetical protein n=1 Tax=Pseudoprimorskyibacter insulae TaxID=1695997 RepID=UPI0015E85403|nr:hypothetical protein [Pseudoprimorskyibacter insulae]